MKSGNPQVSGISRRNEFVSPCRSLSPKRYSALEMKMGRGGQDEPAGKSEITSNEKMGGVVSCGPFPIP